MARKKISTTVYITPEQNEALHVLHERTKVPVAVYIREGIDLALARYADQMPGQLSLVGPAPNRGGDEGRGAPQGSVRTAAPRLEESSAESQVLGRSAAAEETGPTFKGSASKC